MHPMRGKIGKARRMLKRLIFDWTSLHSASVLK